MLSLIGCTLVAVTSATNNPRIIQYEDVRILQSGPKSYVYYCQPTPSMQKIVIKNRASGMREFNIGETK